MYQKVYRQQCRSTPGLQNILKDYFNVMNNLKKKKCAASVYSVDGREEKGAFADVSLEWPSSSVRTHLL